MLIFKYNALETMLEVKDKETKEIVAVCDFNIDDTETIIEIEGIRVNPSYRRQGIGTAIIERLERDYPNAECICGDALRSAFDFWASLGATFSKSTNWDDEEGEPESWYFEIPINI